MPLTDTLKSAEEFRRVGFTDEPSNLLVNKLEETAHAQVQDLKEFIRSEFGQQRAEFERRMEAQEERTTARFEALEARMEAQEERWNARLEAFEERTIARIDVWEGRMNVKFENVNTRIESVRAELYSSQRKQMASFATILVISISLAVAVIKLFPNLG